jgi:Peptidase family M28
MRTFLLVSAVSALAVIQVHTQGSGAWFGLPLPNGLGDPHRPVVDVRTVTPPAVRVPGGEERFSDLAGAKIRRDLETIVGFSKQSRAAGDRVWGRVTGFPAAAATHAWVAEQFRAAGLQNVQVQPYEASAPMWWATSWEVRVVASPAYGPGSRDVILESAVPTSGSQIDGGSITAPLVNVGSVTDAALPAVDVKGKVAVQHLKPAGGAYSERGRTTERARELTKRGAVAILNVVEQTGNMHVRDFGNCGAPCFNIGTADGAFLDGAIQNAPRTGAGAEVRVQLRLDGSMRTGLRGQNAFGLIPSKSGSLSGESIIINAHADGWYDAAGDNGDGLAVLVAMARHFSRQENRLDRTLVFVASGGHHSTGLNGPSNFVRLNRELAAQAVLVLNLEHIAQFRIMPGPWTVQPTEQPMSFGISNAAPFLIELGKRGVERSGFNLNPEFGTSVPGDLGGYEPLKVPRVQAIHSGPMYHTSGDVLESISVPGLERAARFYTFFVTEVAKATRSGIDPGRK